MLELVLGVVAIGLLGGGIAVANNNQISTTTPTTPPSLDPFFRFDYLFKSYGNVNQVPWWMLKAICMNESSLGQAESVAYGIVNPDDVDGSISEDGKSWGLMQMTLPTARDYDGLATPQKLNNAEYSVNLASKHVRHLIVLFGLNNEEFLIKAYNQGEGNSKKEMAGKIEGYAQEYWDRYQRNKKQIQSKQGL